MYASPRTKGPVVRTTTIGISGWGIAAICACAPGMPSTSGGHETSSSSADDDSSPPGTQSNPSNATPASSSDDGAGEDDASSTDADSNNTKDSSGSASTTDTDDSDATQNSDDGDDDDTDDATNDDSSETSIDPDTFDNNCQRVLSAALRFYNGQRCGDADNRLLLDNDNGPACHSDDGSSSSADLSGGWHDAGDHIKFTLTNAATAHQLMKAYTTFPESFKDVDDFANSGNANGVPDVLDQARHGLDYLAKLLVSDNRFVARVGDDKDHSRWSTSPYDWKVLKTPRTVFEHGQADVAGISAAALALAARAYADFDSERAERYHNAALAQHDFALSHTGTTSDNFYQDNTWKDSVLCSATELYRLTQNTEYFDLAQRYDDELGRVSWVLDWSNPVDTCRHSLYEAGSANALESLIEEVESNYLGKISSQAKVAGMAYFMKWGALRYANNAAFSAGLAWHASDDPDARARYAAFTASQVEFVLGDNPYDRSFIVGLGNNPPTQPHHQNAYGTDEGTPSEGSKPEHIILGALVGGPNTEEGYEDSVRNYVTNEVTIDYNAAIVGSLAALASMDAMGQFGGDEHCAAIDG